jgi:hypothetical protein
MKLTQGLATAITALAIAVPAAGATPDGYQPQLRPSSQPDAFMRHLRNSAPAPRQSDAFTRYLRNNAPQAGAAAHPDSRGARVGFAVSATPVTVSGDDGTDLATGVIGALLGAFVTALAIVGASSIRGRRGLAGAS